jgi:LmbE family N-acetylglucosaminyl deacetylase
MTDSPQLLDESFSRVLAIVAHPDDLEYGAAAAVARWTDAGKTVVYCLATRGEAGIDGIAPEEAGPLREAEQIASAAVVGVDVVEFLDHPDGTIEYGVPLRRDIARMVRKHRPDVVVTGNFHPTFPGGWLNQADHIAVGRAALDGVRDAGNRWIFRELADEGLEPWSPRALLVAASPLSAHFVDVTDTFERGVASLEAHAAYLEGLGDHPMANARETLESMLRPGGSAIGVTYATAFEFIGL